MIRLSSEFQQIQPVDLWFDGSAVDLPVKRLGAGWLQLVGNKIVEQRNVEIKKFPETNYRALFAEIVAASRALGSVRTPSQVTIYGDNNEVLDFIRHPKINRNHERKKPELLVFFNRLRGMVMFHEHVEPQHVDSAVEPLRRPFHAAVHNLAAQATGSHKILRHPDLDSVLASLTVQQS